MPIILFASFFSRVSQMSKVDLAYGCLSYLSVSLLQLFRKSTCGKAVFGMDFHALEMALHWETTFLTCVSSAVSA